MIPENGFSVTGWDFKGWAITPNGEVRYQNGDVVQGLIRNGETFTLYARWEPHYYNVKYVAISPDNTESIVEGYMESVTMKYDSEYVLDKTLYKLKGYVFNGWNTKADGSGDSYADEETVSNLTSDSSGTVTLYAQWLPITYTIEYNANGGVGEMQSSTHKYDTSAPLSKNIFVKEGYIFTGWIDSNGNGYRDEQNVENWSSKSSTIVLYAQWEAISYSVVYNANGGVGVIAAYNACCKECFSG